MNKSKIQISAKIIDAVTGSRIISESEKINFLKYIGYLSYNEQKQFVSLI